MNDNKTDWSEKRFQIVLKLLNKKQDGTYLDCKQIEEQADELMRYLQQDEQDNTLNLVYKAIRSEMAEKWRIIQYSGNQHLYINGVGDAFGFVRTVIDKIERETSKHDSGTN